MNWHIEILITVHPFTQNTSFLWAIKSQGLKGVKTFRRNSLESKQMEASIFCKGYINNQHLLFFIQICHSDAAAKQREYKQLARLILYCY